MNVSETVDGPLMPRATFSGDQHDFAIDLRAALKHGVDLHYIARQRPQEGGDGTFLLGREVTRADFGIKRGLAGRPRNRNR